MKKYTPLLLIVLSIAVFFGFIDPQYAEIQKLRAEESEYVSALEKAENLNELMDDLSKKYESFSKTDLEKLNTILPQEVDQFRLLNDLDYVAKRNGISVSNIDISGKTGGASNNSRASEGGDAYNILKIGFAFEATYETAKIFLKDLEKSLQIIDVVSIGLSPQEGGLYNFSVSFSTYSLK